MSSTDSIRSQAHRDLNTRSRLGAVIYVITWIIVVSITRIDLAYPLLVYGIGGYLLLAAIARIGMVRRFEQIYAAGAERWYRLFAASVIVTALPWSLATAWIVSQQGLTFASAILMKPILMFCAGSVYSLTPSRPLFRTYALVVAVPTLLALVHMHTIESVSMALFSLIFFGLLGVISHKASDDYFRMLKDKDNARLQANAMEHARQLAESASQVKSAFLANMSHEIRTPLNAIIGLARIGQRDCTERKLQENFNQIRSSGELLSQLINDILDFSRLEAGKIKIDNHAFSLRATMHATTDLLLQAARDKSLDLTLKLSADLPDTVLGDALRLQQVLMNLLSNAIKFTDDGAVSLAVQRVSGGIRFTVSDTGIGMSGEQVERLFAPFEQVDSSTTRRHGGSGLGLAISQGLARAMGGEITVASRPDAGSRFTLTLPLPAIPATRDTTTDVQPAGHALPLHGVRVLCADDVEINRVILEDILHKAGADVVQVDDGQQAVEASRQQGPFDIVLMDVQMPVMDGFEATRQILRTSPALPVIGLTAHALPEERFKCFAAGMVDHVSKPVDEPTLIEAILARLDQRSPTPATTAEDAPPAAPPTRH